MSRISESFINVAVKMLGWLWHWNSWEEMGISPSRWYVTNTVDLGRVTQKSVK